MFFALFDSIVVYMFVLILLSILIQSLCKLYIVNSVLPDEEDLTLTLPNEDNNSFIKLKDKEYDATNFSGKGTKIIRKNIVEVT